MTINHVKKQLLNSNEYITYCGKTIPFSDSVFRSAKFALIAHKLNAITEPCEICISKIEHSRNLKECTT